MDFLPLLAAKYFPFEDIATEVTLLGLSSFFSNSL
jgi:hypothetical protein